MRLITILLSLFISLSAIAQTHSFTPNWKVGTVKKVTKQVTTTKKGVTTTKSEEFTIEVIEETDAAYIVSIESDEMNEGLGEMMNMANKDQEETEQIEEEESTKDFTIEYSISKSTGEAQLHNWEEIEAEMKPALEELQTKLNEMEQEDTEEAKFGMMLVKMIVGPMMDMFGSKEGLESAMMPYIIFLTVPFGTEYEIGKPISETATEGLPESMSGMALLVGDVQVTATVSVELTKVDEVDQVATFYQITDMDTDFLKEMVKNMMTSLGDMFDDGKKSKKDKKKAQEAQKEIEDMEMELTMNATYYYNMATTYTQRVEMYNKVEIPGSDKEPTITEIVLVIE